MFPYATRRTDEYKRVFSPLELPLNHRSSGTPDHLSLLSLTVLKICPSFWDWSQDKDASARFRQGQWFISQPVTVLWYRCGSELAGRSCSSPTVSSANTPEKRRRRLLNLSPPLSCPSGIAVLYYNMICRWATPLFLLTFNNNHLLWNCFNISHIEPFRSHLIHHF